MKITNVFNLPEEIFSAIMNDDYDGPKHDSPAISVTTLIGPVRKYYLTRRHYNEIVEDASERIWVLLGRAIHYILQIQKTHRIVEERVEKEIDGVIISGKMDILDDAQISDYKVTSVWQYVHNKNGKFEHAAQLNVGRWLLADIFPNISKLFNHLILRDWSKRMAKQSEDMPQIPFISIPAELWSAEKTIAYIRERVALFVAYKDLSDDDLPPCTPDECWEKPTVWAVKKIGGKRAIPGGVCLTEAEAQVKCGKGLEIEVRKGGRIRCEEYCSVNQFCNIYKAYKESK